jgi:hypothetical protein
MVCKTILFVRWYMRGCSEGTSILRIGCPTRRTAEVLRSARPRDPGPGTGEPSLGCDFMPNLAKALRFPAGGSVGISLVLLCVVASYYLPG